MDTDVLVIGGGLSGLVAANIIQDANKNVTVLDKGRSTGGRLATRRIQNGIADHGAQFFTARTDEFKAQVEAWLQDDLVYVWGHGWSDGSLKRTVPDGHPRYVTRGGMNNLATHLTESLNDVRVNIKVGAVGKTDDGWWVTDGDGESYTARAIVMTPPTPQALALLADDIPIKPEEMKELKRIEYGPCLCGIFVVDGDVELPPPGAIQNFNNIVYWVADNKEKGISPDERIITMHAAASWSRKHYDAPDDESLAFFREELQQYLQDGATIKEAQLKKWRYSVPMSTYPHDIMQPTGLSIVFAGDGYGGRGRVEGAFMSGYAAGHRIIEILNNA